MASKKKIELPQVDTQGEKPSIQILDPEEIVKRYDRQTNLIIAIFVIALVTMIITTATLVIDSFHINSATYHEYSQKNEVYNSLLEENRKQQELMLRELRNMNSN